MLAAVAAGRDLLLEGPPGTSKTTLLSAITSQWHIPLVFVEGNADLTPSRLVGHHNPSRVLREDYSADNFVDGPLLDAMRSGGFLYIEELNRAPEDTLNTLLTAMAERRISVPRVGTVHALATFRVVASMNPFDNIGTSRLSTSVLDRMCRLSVDYQDEAAEQEIVRLRTQDQTSSFDAGFVEQVLTDAVALTRSTRDCADVRQGSSVRGAIDLMLVAAQLFALRSVATVDRTYVEVFYDALVVALSGRIVLDEAVDLTPEAVLRRLWADYFQTSVVLADPGRRDRTIATPSDSPAVTPTGRRPLSRKPKTLTEPPSLYMRPGSGERTLQL